MKALEGYVSVVTGAGSGIGRAVVQRFVAEGSQVVGLDIDKNGLAKTAALLGAEGAAFTPTVLDITDSAAVNAEFAAIAKKLGPIDVLANVAGIHNSGPAEAKRIDDLVTRVGQAEDEGKIPPKWDLLQRVTDEEFWKIIKVNLFAPFACMRAAVPLMGESGRGSIINFASIAAFRALPRSAAYTAAKAGVAGLTRGVAAEVADRGIRVNTIAPASIDTPMLASSPVPSKRPPSSVGNLGREGSPEEVAAVVLFLASKESSYITGQLVGVNGGRFMH